MSDNNDVFEIDPNALAAAIQAAPDAGYINQNFGQLTLTPMVVHWVKNDKGEREKVSRKGANPDKSKGESLELEIKINIAEFNPSLEFEYTRNIPVRVSTDKDKSDWSEIVEPSLIKVFGKDWIKKVLTRPYVCIEDVANVNRVTSKRTGKVVTTPKFIAVYANMAECKAAHDARYSGGNAEPDADTALTAAVDTARNILSGVGDNLDEAKRLLLAQLPQYDPEQLIALALV